MRRGRPRRGGFTLLEVLAVMTISAVLLGTSGLVLGRYLARTSARRAAQVFAQDLAHARMLAVRGRASVVVRFHESTLRYELGPVGSADPWVSRSFGGAQGIDLSLVALDLAGDSLVFDRRGVADLSGAGGSLGRARFQAGPTTYTVRFNGLGAARVEAS